MKTIVTTNIRRNKKHLKRLVLCLLVSALVAGGVATAHAQNKSSMSIVPFGAPPSKPTEVFQNVKEVHLYVCNYRWGEGLPDLLKPEALAQEELKLIKAFIDMDNVMGIKFVDGQKHEPIVTTEQPCEALYDPAMDEPGNLSVIVKVFPVLDSNYPQISHRFAILTHFLYRPDHKNSIATILRAEPQVIWDLQADEATIRSEIHLTVGSDNYGIFSKPNEHKHKKVLP